MNGTIGWQSRQLRWEMREGVEPGGHYHATGLQRVAVLKCQAIAAVCAFEPDDASLVRVWGNLRGEPVRVAQEVL